MVLANRSSAVVRRNHLFSSSKEGTVVQDFRNYELCLRQANGCASLNWAERDIRGLASSQTLDGDPPWLAKYVRQANRRTGIVEAIWSDV